MVGNVIVCIIFFCYKCMCNCIYFFVMNLVVFDIGIMLCLFYVILEWRYNEWILGEVMCKLVYLSLIMFYFVIINILFVIVVYCFLMLVFLFCFKFSKSKVGFVILFIWLVVFFCVLFFFGVRMLDFKWRK